MPREHKISDKDLIKKILEKKDEQAWIILKGKYQKRIHNFCKLMLKNVKGFSDIEDTVLEVFFRVYKNLNQYKEIYEFSTWLFSIAEYLCLERIKKDVPIDSLDESIRQGDDKLLRHEIIGYRDVYDNRAESQEDELLRKERIDILSECLMALESKLRVVLILYYIEKFNDREISEILSEDITPNGIRTRRLVAQQKLRECINFRIKFGKKGL